MGFAAITLLGALGLCNGASPAAAAPELELSLAVTDAGRALTARSSFALPPGPQRFYLDSSLKIHASSLDGQAIALTPQPGATSGINAYAVNLDHTARLALEYSGTLAAFDPTIDFRKVMQAHGAMGNAEWAWLPASAYWHPMLPQGFAGYRLQVRPHQGLAVTAGKHQALDDGRASFEFAAPVAGIDLLIGPYQRSANRIAVAGARDIEVVSYFTAATADLTNIYLNAASQHLQGYSASIGAYPFSSFTMVASPLPTGFGMPGLTWLGEAVLRLPFIPSTSLRHEVLHNWWGNGVRVDYQRGNWSEGLTTLMADFATKLEQDPEAGPRQRMAWMRDWIAVPAAERSPLRDFRYREHGRLAAVGYSRAAFLLWMLQQELGPSAWQQGLQRFWQDCRHQPASWEDLHAALASAQPGPIWSHFDAWLDQSELPQLELAAVAALNSERTAIRVSIKQTGPIFAFRLPLRLTTSGAPEWHLLDINAADNELTITAQAPIEVVALDPELTILREPLTGELPPVLRNLVLAANPEIVLATGTSAWRSLAEQLAQQLFERPASVIEAPAWALAGTREPALILGHPDDVRALLQNQALTDEPPGALDEEAEVKVWTLAKPIPRVIAVLASATAEAVQALAARLPHYGGESYLSFRQGQVIARGVWPLNPQERAVRVDVD